MVIIRYHYFLHMSEFAIFTIRKIPNHWTKTKRRVNKIKTRCPGIYDYVHNYICLWYIHIYEHLCTFIYLFYPGTGSPVFLNNHWCLIRGQLFNHSSYLTKLYQNKGKIRKSMDMTQQTRIRNPQTERSRDQVSYRVRIAFSSKKETRKRQLVTNYRL